MDWKISKEEPAAAQASSAWKVAKEEPATTPSPTAKKPTVEPSKPSTSPFAPQQERILFDKTAAVMPPEIGTNEKIPFQSLIDDEQRFSVINDFMASIGKPYSNEQSREDFVKDYMQQMRKVDWNVPVMLGTFNNIANTDKKTAEKIANAYILYDTVDDAYSDQGQPGIRPYVDIAKAAVTDPTNYIGFGAGAIGKNLLGRGAAKATIRNRMKSFLIAAAADVPVAGIADLYSQKLEHAAQQKRSAYEGETPEQIKARQDAPFEYDALRGGINIALSTIGAAATAAPLDMKKPGVTLKDKMQQAPVKAPTTAAVNKAKKEVTDATNANIDLEVRKFVQEQGEEVLRQVGPESALADAKVRNALTGNAVNVAMNIIKATPDFELKQGEKISDAINRVLATLDTTDSATLEAAMRQSNVNLDEMAAAVRVTQSEAGRTLQQVSVVQRMLNRMSEIDPNFKKQMDDLYKGFDDTDGKISMFFDAVKRTERFSKAMITSGVDTTVRNLMGSTVGLTAKSAVRLMEGTTYSVYKSVESIITGKPADYTFGQNMTRAWEDSIRLGKYMRDAGLSKEITDELLKDNPSLQRRLLGMQEDDRDLDGVMGKVATWAQTLNHFQDQFYRRAVFAESIDRQLNDVGLNLFEVMRDGKLIPKDVIARATDDALKATFSYMPNSSLGGKMKDPVTGEMVSRQTGLDAMVERRVGQVVNFIEDTPFASLVIPFPRFMANAMAFQYRYSPFGLISTVGDFNRLNKAAKAGADEATQIALRHQAMEHSMQTIVGTAALAAAIDYRRNNQDTQWGQMKNDDGSVTDVRAIFPMSFYLAVADAYVKLTGSGLKGDNQGEGVPFDATELMETIAGMKLPAGSQNTVFDTIANALNSDDAAEELTKSVGKVFGDFAGRFTQPFVTKQVYDMVDALRGEDIARDPNVTELTGWRGAIETATQTVQAKLPIVKESLPKAVPRFEEEKEIERKGEFFARIFGARSSYAGSDLNKEFNRLGMKPWELVGRRTGNKALDNKIVEAINEKVLPAANTMISSPSYINNPSDLERRKDLVALLRDRVAQVRKDVIEREDIAAQDKMWYRSQSKTDKARIRAEYRRRTNGKELEEDDAYSEAKSILKELNATGYTGLNKGGFVQRRH